MHAGMFFGEISVLLDEPATAGVVARTPLRLAVIDRSALMPFLLANPTVTVRLLQAEARRISDAEPMARIDERSFSGAIDLSFSAASQYLPIGEHGVIGDLRTVALVGTDGTIDWYCCPRFDSPSVFGAILDRRRGGRYRISPTVGVGTVKQLYFPDTNVLITRFLTPVGVGELQDFMPVGPRQRLVRRVLCVRGEMSFRVEVDPRFDYGREPHETVVHEHGVVFKTPSLSSRWPRESASASAMKASWASSRSSPARASRSSSRR